MNVYSYYMFGSGRSQCKNSMSNGAKMMFGCRTQNTGMLVYIEVSDR